MARSGTWTASFSSKKALSSKKPTSATAPDFEDGKPVGAVAKLYDAARKSAQKLIASGALGAGELETTIVGRASPMRVSITITRASQPGE